MSNVSSVLATLHHLIETCRDGEEGFRIAAGGVDDDHLRILFDNYCQQRAQLANELEREVHRLDTVSQSATGALHRGWMNIKSVISGHEDSAILAECERGEDAAIDEYEEALKTDLPAKLKQVVSRQYAAVKAAHDRIRELEESYAT